MERGNIVFSKIDRAILESYKVTVGQFSAYLGPGYEMVVHSLENLEHSVVAIYNGSRSGRKVGAPVTDLALKMLHRLEESGESDSITYRNRTRDGVPLYSTTIIIRGERKRAIGLICINFYMDTPLYGFLDTLNPPENAYSATPIETMAEEAKDLISGIVEEARSDVEKDPSVLPSCRNKMIIKELYLRGVFNLKNAVPDVAECLGISKNTVYMHLRNIDR